MNHMRGRLGVVINIGDIFKKDIARRMIRILPAIAGACVGAMYFAVFIWMATH